MREGVPGVMSDDDAMDMDSGGDFASGSEEVVSDEDWKEERPVMEQQKSFQVRGTGCGGVSSEWHGRSWPRRT